MTDKIDKPGIYDITLERYHSDCCVGPSISNSGLKQVLHNPAEYWWDSYLNKDRPEPDPPGRPLIMGQAAHHLLLGQKQFADKFVVRPNELAGYRWNGNRMEHRRWLEKQAKAGKIVVLPDEIDAIRHMRDNLAKHPTVQAGIINGEVEKSMIWERDGIWLKNRPDVLPASDIICDLKTCADTDFFFLRRAIENHRYDMQAALSCMAMQALRGIRPREYWLVFVRTKPPYDVCALLLKSDYLHWGMRDVLAAITVFKDCLKTGNWHGSWRDTEEVGPSKWYDDSHQTASDNRELPPLPQEWMP